MTIKEIATVLSQIRILKPTFSYPEPPQVEKNETSSEYNERYEQYKQNIGLYISLLGELNYGIAMKALKRITENEILFEKFNKNPVVIVAQETQKLTYNEMEEQGRCIATQNGQVYLLVEKYKTLDSISNEEEVKTNNAEKIYDKEYIYFLEDVGTHKIYGNDKNLLDTMDRKKTLYIKIREKQLKSLNKIKDTKKNATRYNLNEVLNIGKRISYEEII